VAKTGRCLIVHEAPLSGGWGGEIAAQIARHGLASLLAPIERVTGYDVIVPYAQLESAYLPSEQRILAAAKRILEYA
jgi:pyruvate dehydrogenase E1 component beta subunit